MNVRSHLSRPLLCFLLVCSWQARADPEVQIERRNGVFHVRAEMPVGADAATAWQVLTDYNRLAEFVPDMRSSRVVSAPGEPLLLEQKGETSLLIFSFNIEVVLRVEETPPHGISFRAVGGNMKQMRGAWRIDAAGLPVKIGYQVEIEPGFWVPPLIGSALMRRDVRRKIDAVVQEMQKRYAAAHPRAAPQ